MFPILYDQITAGVVPQHNGLGVLSDCVSCYVEQSRNSKYELTMVYMASGIHANEIAERRILKVKPNFTDDPQLFRIDRIGKTMNGKFTVFAKHISYDLSSYEITGGTANSAVAACSLLESAASGYTIRTDKTATGNFKIDIPASVRSYFAGRSGSFLDVFGTAEIKYDNFDVDFLLHAGEDRGITIRYGKNLLELSQETDGSNLYSHVLCFYKSGEGNAIVGNKVATGLTLDVPKTLILDVTSSFDSEPTVADLTAKATDYKDENNLTVPNNNIKLDFVQSGELTGRVDLCDTVSIYYEALGITRTQVKCIRTKWDCINEKYVETEFGDAKGGITETISVMQREVAEKPSTSVMEQAINAATSLITGNSGGYVVMHDTNNDGEPDEILIMDAPDILSAVNVIRMNQNGVGLSTTGYSGNYTTAFTAQGIVADAITTGTLNADLIKAGVIEDVNHKSQIDMTSGQAKLFELIAKRNVTLIDDDNITLASLTGLINNGRSLRLYNSAGDTILVDLQVLNDKGFFVLKNASGNTKVNLWIGGNDDGIIDLSDSNGDVAIAMSAARGQIECKRIKPYEVIVGPDGEYGMIGSGPWSVVGADWKIHRMGNVVFMAIPFSGNGASISAGSNAFSGYFSKGAMPILPVRWSGFSGSTHLDMSIDTSGNIAIRVIGSAINLPTTDRVTICGCFLVDD